MSKYFETKGKGGAGTARQYEVGKTYSGVKILERHVGSTAVKNNRYHVEHQCCEREEWMTHAGLCSRVQKGTTHCRWCATERREPPARKAQHKPLVATDANGYEWPHLGTLGPRWASA